MAKLGVDTAAASVLSVVLMQNAIRSSLRSDLQEALRELVLVQGAALLIAVSAKLAIVLPFTPVPVTGQTLAVLGAGAVLGPRRGAAAVILYLLEGFSGLPFFAIGGPLTVGYLAGFAPAAFVVGRLRGKAGSGPRLLLAFLAGEALIFAGGVLWLSHFVGPWRAIALGLLPFVPGELLKLSLAGVVAAGVGRGFRRF